MTKKQMIIDYVAINDGATYTQIIKFIFEHNHPGKGYAVREGKIVNYPWSGYSNMTCEGPNCC